jgi:hypothetical protein
LLKAREVIVICLEFVKVIDIRWEDTETVRLVNV